MKYWLFTSLVVVSALFFSQQKTVDGFTSIEIDGPVVVELVAAETNGIEALEEADLVEWEQNGNSLVVMGRYKRGRDAARVRIQVADLQMLETTSSVVVEGQGEFATRRMEITANAQSIITMDIDVEQLDLEADAQSIVTLNGQADAFTLEANAQSIINAGGVRCGTIDAEANHQSVVTINSGDAKVNSSTKNQSIINGVD